jgi:WD40 repeat protein
VTRLKPLAGKLKGLLVYSNFEGDKGLTAAGHEVIAGLTALEWLRLQLNDGLVTDADLMRLAKLPRLRELELLQAGYEKPTPAHTVAGVAEFRRLRPDVHLHINFDGKTEDYPVAPNQVAPSTPQVPKVVKLNGPPLLVAKGKPLAPHATVNRPAAIVGVRSWSVERAGHVGNVRNIAWSPKGNVIATGGTNDLSVRLWDRDGNLKRVLLGHEGEVYAIAFSPDGSLLASGDRLPGDSSIVKTGLGAVRLWDVASGTCKGVVPLRDWCFGIAFSPDGRYLAIGCTKGIFLLTLTDGMLRALNDEDRDQGTLIWSPDGLQLLIATGSESLKVYDVRTGQKAADFAVLDWAEGKPKRLEAAAWSPDGQWIAGGGSDGKLRIWNAKTRKHVQTLETLVGNITCVAWHPESKMVAASGSGGKDWQTVDAMTGKLLANGTNVAKQVLSVAWSPEGKELALLTSGSDTRGTPLIYDPLTGQILRQGKEHRVYNLGAFSQYPLSASLHAGAFLHKARELGTLRVFDSETGQLRSESPAPTRTGFLFAPKASGGPSSGVVNVGSNRRRVSRYALLCLKQHVIRGIRRIPAAIGWRECSASR